MRGKTIIPRISAIVFIACSCLFVMWFVFGCKEKTEPTGRPEQTKEVAAEQQEKDTIKEYLGQLIFELDEVSVFDLPDIVRTRFIFGVYAECLTDPAKEVSRYPAFQSDKPLFGSLQVGGVRAEANTGYHYRFALDESAGSGQGYDRMYIDMNLNGDLTDDGCCLPMKDVPAKALITSGSLTAQVCFEPIKLCLMPQDDSQRRLEVMPRFFAYGGKRSYATLMTTKAHEGLVEIGGEKFKAVLGHGYEIPGWFDHPATALYLLAPEGSIGTPATQWYGGQQLMAMHRHGDTYYRLSATPDGDKLFVCPYQGAFGVLEVKSGGRNAARASATGSLISKDTAISLTEGHGTRNTSSSDSYRLPVGDYCPLMMNITYGTLQCMILRNSHADGAPRGRAAQGPPVYAIAIREDKPFVLDFSGKPQVLFASPGKDHRVARGDQLDVKAVLIDPELDIMFRSVRQVKQLDPKVIIKRANDEIVAEGVMPFG